MKTAKKIVFPIALLISSFVVAQKGVIKQASYTAHAGPGWYVDVNKAYEASEKTGKPILANFTGSDWCGWCVKLGRDVFSKAEFKEWAEKNVILLELDYPRRHQLPPAIKEQNAGLQQAFKVTGYPTIWVFNLDKDDKGQFQISALGKTGYRRGVVDFTSDVDAMLAKGKTNN